MTVAIYSSTSRTKGVKYAGSKLRLLPHILKLVRQTGAETVLDGFSGTTRVSQALAADGVRVTANDTSDLSRVFAECFLTAKPREGRYAKLIESLNRLPGKDGWFSEHYGGDPASPESIGPDGLKKPFQLHNTRRLDAIRDEIDRLSLSRCERSVALTSLVLALDKVDNTIGHFASYLREWSPRSYGDLRLEVPRFTRTIDGHEVLQEDAADAAERTPADLAYFDPPYGSNNAKMPPSRVRYGAYYHFWKTVILNDRPELFGKAKRRKDSADDANYSPYEDFRFAPDGEFVAVNALRDLLSKTSSRFVLLSYSSGGRATRRSLEAVMRGCGDIVAAVEVDLRRNVMAEMSWTKEWTREGGAPNREYLFLLAR
ncbi:MAG: DNA adenine methylase [Acidobacteriota bacterium]|nr:MAG: DNA adenine methylase [Acidobacteriota bacterium]